MYILIVLDHLCHCPLCAINKNLITVIDDSLSVAFLFEGKGKVRAHSGYYCKEDLPLPSNGQSMSPSPKLPGKKQQGAV